MDGSRFDRLARDLVAGRSRRTVAKGIAGGLAAAVTLVGRRATVADHKPEHCAHAGEKVQSRKGCCADLTAGADGRCAAPGPFGAACTSNAGCASGVCACRAHDCSGGGLCADAYSGTVDQACFDAGGGVADVRTPGGAQAEVCARDAGSFCPSGACSGAEQVCAIGNFCIVLVDE
jgi:hypothetical protein